MSGEEVFKQIKNLRAGHDYFGVKNIVRAILLLLGIIGLSNTVCADLKDAHSQQQIKNTAFVGCAPVEFKSNTAQYHSLPWVIMSQDQKLATNFQKILKENLNSQEYGWVSTNMVSKRATAFHHGLYGDLIGFIGCKPHSCDSTKIFVVFSPSSKKINVAFKVGRSYQLFGDFPTHPVFECLDREK